MSIHAIDEHHDFEGEGPGREMYYWAECACGWVGERVLSVTGNSPWHDIRADYRRHVEEALGAEAYYLAGVRCTNCGGAHEQPIVIGPRGRGCRCQRCGISSLIPDNEAYHDEGDRMKQWRF